MAVCVLPAHPALRGAAAVAAPAGLYIAMAAYHPQMLPMGLLRSIIESKQAVPFPTAVEVLGLLLAFELLQEAGVSLPQAVGQTLSIIGGLVVGTAAVEARVISPAALIVVAAAGICGFVLPGRDFADAMRLWRFLLAVLAALGGLFGLTVGGILLLLHLAGLESFWPTLSRAVFVHARLPGAAASAPHQNALPRPCPAPAGHSQSEAVSGRGRLRGAAAAGLAVLALLIWGLPFPAYETATLLPVETVQLARTVDGRVLLRTEAGDGVGADWSAAVRELRANAPERCCSTRRSSSSSAPTSRSCCKRRRRAAICVRRCSCATPSALRGTDGLAELLHAHESDWTLAEVLARLRRLKARPYGRAVKFGLRAA